MTSELRVDKIIPTTGVPTGGGGGVIQVVTGSYGSETDVTTTSYADSGLTCNITPKFSTSKILIFVSQVFRVQRSATVANGGIRLVRGSTVIVQGPNQSSGIKPYGLQVDATGSGTSEMTWISRYNLTYLDSPATTSATTYKTQQAVYSSGQFRTQYQTGGENGISYITLMEVSA